ncbi:trichohyalin-like [Procambarus clarkii]|uniref:trichohyalin-like n=1 Tax=Procambarus clarkii TaxID=6728 RepID=UPI003743D91D
MEDDKVAKFIDTRDEQVLEDCTKAQLQLIADYFGIKLRSSKVGEKRLEIVAQLRARDEALREERHRHLPVQGENLSIGESSRGSSGSRRIVRLEIMKLQLEAQLKREEQEAQLKCEEREAQLRREERVHEAQLKHEEREAQLKREEAQLKREERQAQLRREEREQEAQLKRKERELETKLKQQEIEANKEVELKRAELGLAPPAPPKQEDRRVRERDLPVFVPNEAEGFFDHFERVATLKKWPRAEWAELVQGRLTGEACEAYNMLDLKECTNYDAVKRAPECYRKIFRECTRSPGKSYAEMARDMERKILNWLESEGVKSAEDVKRLMVMEKFMSVLSPEIRIRVKEADIKDLRAAADMLEEALQPRREGPHRPPVYSGYGSSFWKTDRWRTGTSSPSPTSRVETEGDRKVLWNRPRSP